MTKKYFGTDGIRGTANVAPMTADMALRVGMAAGRHFTRGDHRHRVVIGRDTRLSNYMLEPALTSGFIAVGMDVVQVAVMPTPAVAMLTRSLRADLGVMVSASHNSFEDNGIKLFGPDGYKLSDEVEIEIEGMIDEGFEQGLADSANLGRLSRLENARGRYIEFAKNTFPRGLTLEGLKVVIDCANGAAWRVAKPILWELGADVVTIGTEPDGININQGCGSTAIDTMCAKVRETGADIGIALDGDADRVIIADEKGTVIDGDQVMAIVAAHWHRRNWLRGPVVATVMSNLGLERYLDELEIPLERTAVGDRYVVERMRQLDANVGGEQSGHIVLGDLATTGDGLVAALQVLAVLVENDQPLSKIGRPFDPVPQNLTNVRFSGGAPLEDSHVKDRIAAGKKALAGVGRVVIRKSGTEPLIRIMVECEDEAKVAAVSGDIAEAIQAAAK